MKDNLMRWDPAHQYADPPPHVRPRKFTSDDLAHKIKEKRRRRKRKGYR